MPDEPPRRRITDKDRRRWPDPALDMLADRVDRQGQRLNAIEDELQAELIRLRQRIDRRFDRADESHGRVEQTTSRIAEQTSGTDWRTILGLWVAALSGVGLPFVLYLLAAH